MQGRYFIHTCYLVFYLKIRIQQFFKLLPSPFQNKWFFFFMGISSLSLTSQNNLCHIIWTWKNTPKVSPTILLLFRGLGMILIMKTNSINHIYMYKCSPHQYWSAWKKLKYLQKHFIYLLVILFKDPRILLFTLFFLYTLPCFHPLTFSIGRWLMHEWKAWASIVARIMRECFKVMINLNIYRCSNLS